MRAVVMDTRLIAACGMYCGGCQSYINEKCPGCHARGKTLLCQVRGCCRDRGIHSCGDCSEFGDPSDCGTLDNLFTRITNRVRNTDRIECVRKIQDVGPESYAKFMAWKGKRAIPIKT